MEKIKKERFNTLISRLDISDDIIEKYFIEAKIEKIELCQINNEMTFYFIFNKLIPKDIYNTFVKLVEKNFKDIATVTCIVRFSFEKNDSIISEYWINLIQPFENNQSTYNMLKNVTWKLEDNKLLILVSNNTVKDFLLRKNINKILSDSLKNWIDGVIDIELHLKEIDEAALSMKEKIEYEEKKYITEVIKKNQEQTKKAIVEVESITLKYGRTIKENPRLIKDTDRIENNVVIQGEVFSCEIRHLKSGLNIAMINVTDYSDSIQTKAFINDEKKYLPIFQAITNGMNLKIRGNVQIDKYTNELVLMINDLEQITIDGKEDVADEKRVELHLHTNISAMDGVTSVKKYIEQASIWGHKAIAITDHGVVQAFPEAYEAGKKHGVKVVYGLEANVINDQVPIVYNEVPRDLIDDTYVIFDTETTGLSAVYNNIIEFGAVKMLNGEILEKFEMFVDPQEPISNKITEITGITDEMVKGAPLIDKALLEFKKFVGDSILVAHNARFDIGFVNIALKKIGQRELQNPVIDTVELARFLYPRLKNYKLNTLCKNFDIDLSNHHRAYHDAEATGHLLWKMIMDLQNKNIIDLHDINKNRGKTDYKKQRPFHLSILVKNQVGLKNLYKLVSKSHIEYFFRCPRIPKSVLSEYHEGLLFGTACDRGELFDAMLSKTPEEIENIARFYDYIEIQPLDNYQHLIDKEIINSQVEVINIHKRIVEIGNKLNIPVVATGDVHYLNSNDEIYRKILVHNQIGGFRYHYPKELTTCPYYTTDEMLNIFNYLDENTAKKIVIYNPNEIVEEIESLKPFPDDLYTPVIEGAEEEVRNMSYENAKNIYGVPLPEIVEKRLERELNSIISNGFSVIYLISHKLVNKSLEDGYLVGSRGSVGSSFVATMTKITEVNPLLPHYICPNCKHSEFITDGSIGSGYDLPDKKCPKCNSLMNKDGQDIPFETFMGFKGDKVPDIDLNFSGDYQPRVHKYTEELFGSDYVFRAGTISTVADKTAYGYVKKYIEENDLDIRSAEVNRLAKGCTGIKRTTGQHPGGLMVIPQYKDVYDFTPIQRPADDMSSDTRTTHFDYHAISGRLLKLDILGHDDPTVIRMLQDLTGVDPKHVPIDDPNVYEIFRSTKPLKITEKQINSKTGAIGIPEFGTKFVRQMLEDTEPTTFAELVRISGLSHGTDVWLNNAQELIRNGKANLSEVICTRDDIMGYLISKDVDFTLSFKIMEKVRKGKGLTTEDIKLMKEHDIPSWYIDSCQKIKYMFPKAHAVAYVLMAVRIAYFKVYYPIQYYATYFSIRADEFDIKVMTKGSSAILAKMNELSSNGQSIAPKEKSLLTVLEVALEMSERGFYFNNVDLYKSEASRFLIDDDKRTLIPPFSVLTGCGVNAAKNIVKTRSEGEILSIEDLQTRSKATKTVIEALNEYGCLKDLPTSNQLTFF